MQKFLKPIVCILVIIIIILIHRNTSRAESFLTGVWLAENDEFCKSAEIQSMMLYVGEPVGWFQYERECYIIIMDGFANQDVTITYFAPSCVCGNIVRFTGTAEFGEDQIWKSPLKMEMDMSDGTLVIHDAEDTLVASLYKRHDMQPPSSS